GYGRRMQGTASPGATAPSRGPESMTQHMISQPDPISCETFEEYASAIVDGEVDGAILAALDAHGATCDSCSALIGELAAIKHDARMLPQLAPSRDLWSGIAAQIG